MRPPGTRPKTLEGEPSRKATADALRHLRSASRDLKVHRQRVSDAQDANLELDRNRSGCVRPVEDTMQRCALRATA